MYQKQKYIDYLKIKHQILFTSQGACFNDYIYSYNMVVAKHLC